MKEVLYGNDLAKSFRILSESVKKRFWIIVPYIGCWKDVSKVIGVKWISNISVNVRLLTDIDNQTVFSEVTMKKFQYSAEIRSLKGLHAKIYIIDDKVIYTSANLTGTAFKKRYEFGVIQKINPDLESMIETWWDKADIIDSSWTPTTKKTNNNEYEEGNIKGLKNLWDLPEGPIIPSKYKNYSKYLKAYNHFKNIYQISVERMWNDVPIFHEIDSFFNYLFHEHPGKPSQKYLNSNYRVLTDNKRKMELIRYHSDYKNWLNRGSWDSKENRIKRIQIVQEFLKIENIDSLEKDQIIKIIDCIHSMESLALNRVTFLREQNNSNEIIIEAWKELLFGKDLIEVRMENCDMKLYRFGKSAIQELLSYYYPNDFPIINRNSNSGLMFFGYDIKVY
jgi:hypothetical protein